MPDDPREILKAAGVECAEVGVYRLAADRWEVDSHDNGDESVNAADAAILALYRLAAKYKWQRDEVRGAAQSVHDGHFGQRDDYGDYFQAVDQERLESLGTLLADLDRRWEEHDA